MFEELWIVDTEAEANELIKLGWKFIEIVYKDRQLKEWKGFLSQTLRTVGTVKEPQFLMGRPKGVKPREKEKRYNSLEDVSEYAERLKKIVGRGKK